MQNLYLLALSFMLIGIGAYGGGLVTVPLIQHELVEIRGFLSVAEMSRIVSIAQITPGPIAVNAATFVGYRVAGVVGGLLASLCVVLPSLLILTVLSPIQNRALPNQHFLRVRRGLRAGVLSLLLFATFSYGQGVITGRIELAIAVSAFMLLMIFERKIHPLVVIVGSGLVGLFVF